MRGLSRARIERVERGYEAWLQIKEARFRHNLWEFGKRAGVEPFVGSVEDGLAHARSLVSSVLNGLETELVLHSLGLHPQSEGRQLGEQEIVAKTKSSLPVVRVVGRYAMMKLDREFPLQTVT